MEVAVADSYAQAAQPFGDGFGERRVIIDARGERLDVLRLNKTLSAVPAFEAGVRERTDRISGFRHEAFSRIRSIENDRPTGTLLITADHVRGARLSTLLAVAEKRSVPIERPAAACLIRQLVRAAADWRDQMPDAVHGAIGPDRIMITPNGRLVLVDQIFGSALEQLHYPRQRYWEELGVPLPATFSLTITARADVLQVGAVAVALVLGRRLNATDRLDEIQFTPGDRLTPSLRMWMLRALQRDPVNSFASVLDARAALDEALGEADLVEEQDGLLLFMARCLALDVTAPPRPSDEDASAASEKPPRTDDLPDVDLGTRIEALRAFLARRSARTEPGASDTDTAPPESEPPASVAVEAQDLPLSQPLPPPTPSIPSRPERKLPLGVLASPLPIDWTRRLWLAAATTVVIGIALVALIMGVVPWSRDAATGTFSIDTRPAGIAVTIDGTPRGVTPLALDLAAGEHLVELVTDTERRRIPVTIRAGSESSQFLEMSGTANVTTATELRVRTEPLGAAVTVDGRYVGRSPVSVGDLSPGQHTVVLKHDAGTATEQVLIEPGKTASLFVPLAARAAPVGAAAGWISIVSAPVDVQLFENGRFLGSSRIDRIMLPAGRHDLDIVNEALGFQERRAVQVTAGQVMAINLRWPTGGLSINAVPWALAFIDGAPAGETPIANMQVPIGPHEILLRHPQLGERRTSVIVTSRETAKVGVDLRAK